MKGKHWATLNDEGKKLYGDVFPDGEVTVVSMIPGWAKIGDSEKPDKIYMIRVSDLTPEQFDKILEKVMQNLGGSKEEIKAYFEKENIPFRQSLTSGAGTSDSGFMASMMDFVDEYDDYDPEYDNEEPYNEDNEEEF
jgi:hypothetical protein